MSLHKLIRNILLRFKNIIINLSREEIHYIGGSDILPSPLSESEETRYLNGLQSLDSISAKKKLIEHNLRLVVYIAKKFENTGINLEDLISIGTIGLVKAVNTYKCDKNIKLATYSSRCIENEILMYLRKYSNIKNELSIDEPLNSDNEGNDLLFSDVLGTDNNLVANNMEDNIDKELLKVAMDNLSRRESQIVELRFGLHGKKEKTQKEVADILGISQSYISRLEKKIIRRLKREIDKLA